MMRLIIALLLSLFIAAPVVADESQNLYLLGKTWGFLKYHHPVVRQGCVDWDAELLLRIEEIAAARSTNEAGDQLANWISELNDPAGECKQASSNEVHLQSRNDWITDTTFLGSELSRQLTELAATKVASSPQFYVSLQSGVRNPQFRAEQDHSAIEELDWRYRLLALFRYWNIIEYWFPYRDIIEGDWDSVLAEFIPRLIRANNKDDYVLELMALIARVQDGHANLWGSLDERPPAGDLNVPVHIRFVEGRPLVWSLDDAEPDENSLQFGDVILAVEGIGIDDLIAEWAPYYGVSNESGLRRAIGFSLLRGYSENVSVTVDRAGRELDLTLHRRLVESPRLAHDRDGETLQIISDDIAYLKLSSVATEEVPMYLDAAMKRNGLIIDIRNYPSAFMVFALGQHFVTEKTEFARFTHGDLDQPGVFHWTDPISLSSAEPHYPGQIVIIVDEHSQSQSEYTAMALRSAPNAIVVGNQTAGADGNVSGFSLPGGYRTAISGIGVFYPDKSPTQKVGIVPDIEVWPTIAGIRDGRDEVLEEAVRAVMGDAITEEELRSMTRIPHAPVVDE